MIVSLATSQNHTTISNKLFVGEQINDSTQKSKYKEYAPIVYLNNKRLTFDSAMELEDSIHISEIINRNVKFEIRDSIHGDSYTMNRIEIIYYDTIAEELIKREIKYPDQSKINTILDDFLLKNGKVLHIGQIQCESPYYGRQFPIYQGTVNIYR